MLLGRIDIGQIGVVVPVEEISGSGGSNGSVSSRFPIVLFGDAAGEGSPVGTVPADGGIPEAKVGGIERTVGDHGFFLHQGPVDPIRGLIGEQSTLSLDAGQCLVPLLPRTGRVLVDHRYEIVSPNSIHDDVVLFRSLVFDNAEVGLDPVNSILALGHTSDRFAVEYEFAREGVEVPTAIVHAVAVAILEYGVAPAGVSFPRFVMFDHDLAKDRMMKSKPGLA